MSERQFPILYARSSRDKRDPLAGRIPFFVPWSFVAPHEAQAIRNHDQTLECLVARGGLGVEELAAVLEHQSWRVAQAMKLEEAVEIVERHLGAFKADETAALRVEVAELKSKLAAARCDHLGCHAECSLADVESKLAAAERRADNYDQLRIEHQGIADAALASLASLREAAGALVAAQPPLSVDAGYVAEVNGPARLESPRAVPLRALVAILSGEQRPTRTFEEVQAKMQEIGPLPNALAGEPFTTSECSDWDDPPHAYRQPSLTDVRYAALVEAAGALSDALPDPNSPASRAGVREKHKALVALLSGAEAQPTALAAENAASEDGRFFIRGGGTRIGPYLTREEAEEDIASRSTQVTWHVEERNRAEAENAALMEALVEARAELKPSSALTRTGKIVERIDRALSGNVSAYQERVEGMAKALEPFAARAVTCPSIYADDEENDDDGPWIGLTVGHLRAAKAALDAWGKRS